MAVAAVMHSAPIDATQAMERLRGAAGTARYASAPLTLVYSGAETPDPAYYVFKAQDADGFVIAGGDDLASPVLGYCEYGTFDYANLPEQLKGWLEGYAREIEWARSQPRRSRYLINSRPDRAPIDIQVHAHWNQDAPYNNKTPLLNGSHTATGCVATAIAQIMRCWQYPAVGKGSNSYTWEAGGQTLSMDFSKVTFDWANMPFIHTDSWTSAQDDAVATLMQACGYAMDMEYNTSSGAVTAYATRRLVDYFDYAPSNEHCDRDYYGLYEWEDMIYSSLADNCPVLYHGQGSGGGHAFVVDGYQGDGYFHLNWGWGGSSNGYYLLTALDPTTLGIGGGSGGFNYGQGAVLNLRPNFTGSTRNRTLTAQDYTLSLSGKTIKLSGGVYNMDFYSIPSFYLGMVLTDKDGNKSYVYQSSACSNLASYYGYTSYSVTLPSDLADGTYYINPACKVLQGSDWVDKQMPAPLNLRDHNIITVTNGTLALNTLSDEEITATDLSLGPKLYMGSKCNLHAKLTNPNSTEVYKYVYLGWFNTSNKLVCITNSTMTDIVGNSTITWDIPIVIPSSGLSSGNYKIALLVDDPSNSDYVILISDLVNVTIESGTPSATLSGSNFVVSNASSVYAMDVNIEFDVSCTSGYYANNFFVYVFPGTGGSSIESQRTPEYYLSAGDSKHITFCFPFPAGEANTKYMVAPYYRSTPSSGLTRLTNNYAYFTVGTTGVESVEGDGNPGLFIDGNTARICGSADIRNVEVYDLRGLRHQAEITIDGATAAVGLTDLPAGVYLLRVGTDTGTHTLRLLRK